MKRLSMLLAVLFLGLSTFGLAHAAKYELKIQTALATSSLYYKTLERLKVNIENLSNGQIKVELFGEGAIVKSFEIFDSVSANLINGGMCWTHWASGKHPAGTLFSAPCAGLGYGLDQMSQLSWMWEGEGLKLLNEFYQSACKMNIVAFPALPMGPESFGWFHKHHSTMAEINKLTFRAPPGVPTEIFLDMGMPVVGLSGPDIIPAAQRGAIDASEWIGPAEDIVMGLDQIWKHYYLQGLHQAISIGDIYINKDWYDSLPENLRNVIAISMKTCVMDQLMVNVKANSEALQDLVRNRGVIIEETPAEYYPAFMKSARKVFAKYSGSNAFFKKVMDSQIAWAKMTVPYQMRCNGLNYMMAKTAMDDGMITDYK